MTSFPILDLVVGMIFIYFLLSIICSSMVEVFLTAGRYRAKMLESWLKNIFENEVTLPNGKKTPLGQAIMDHCSTTALSIKGEATSYIDAKNFTEALLEKITYDHNNPKSIAHDLDGLITSIRNTEALPPELQRVLLSYANEAKTTFETVTIKAASEIDLFKSKIEKWYDSNMERVSGALKTRHVRPFTFWTALAIAVLLNVDTINIAQYLYSNPTARANAAAQAYASVKDSALSAQVDHFRKTHTSKDTAAQTMKQLTDTITARVQTIKGARAALEDVIPLGWNDKVFKTHDGKVSIWLILSKPFGLAVTVLAMMMGAPFWFDILNKIANLRGNGNKPQDKEKTA